MTDRRRITLTDGTGVVVLEEWPEHGAWYEPDRPNEVGALYAPAYADGTLPAWDDVAEIAETYEEAGG